MKHLKKVCIMLLIAIICVAFLQSNILAASAGELVDEMVTAEEESELTPIVTNISGTVITVAKVACAGVAIIMLVVLGMKYMMSSVEDRATIKKHAVVYVVGAVVMFSASAILQIIQSFAANLNE